MLLAECTFQCQQLSTALLYVKYSKINITFFIILIPPLYPVFAYFLCASWSLIEELLLVVSEALDGLLSSLCMGYTFPLFTDIYELFVKF